MIRPASFGHNTETAASNVFQKGNVDEAAAILAVEEFDRMVDKLTAHDVRVLVWQDEAVTPKPDAVFPNNWISTHHDGRIVIYPLMAPNRRQERNSGVVDLLKSNYQVREVIDLTASEKEGRYLEGTGSMVFDHAGKMIYACRSPRTDEGLVNSVGELLGYNTRLFSAVDANGVPVYHTNVMMSIGTTLAVVCLDAVRADEDQEMLLGQLADSGRQVVAISYEQMNAFAGNCFEVRTREGEPLLLLSERALQSLLPGQVNALSLKAEILTIEVPTIEDVGGGSVRCMVAGIYLPPAD